ncbi:hypothetical protein Trydic_g22658 [Trypoxylus dichotomus]
MTKPERGDMINSMNRFVKVILRPQSFLTTYRRAYSQIQTSKKDPEIEKILDEVGRILGDKSFRHPHWLITDDILHLATHMQQTKEIEHPIADTARSIISNNDITMGMIAMLFSKIAETSKNQSRNRNNDMTGIVRTHYSIAKVTEMFTMTMKMHKSLSHKESVNRSYGNKIAILCGDYLLGQCFSELAHLRDYNLLEFMGSGLRDLAAGQSFGPRDKNNMPYPFKPLAAKEDTLFPDTFSSDPIEICDSTYNCKSEWILRNILELQQVAYSFGKYFSLAYQALIDTNDLYYKTNTVNLISLPVLLHLQNDKDLYEHIEKYKENIEEVDVSMVREKVLSGVGMGESHWLKREYADAAYNTLNMFEACDAKNLLQDMINKDARGGGTTILVKSTIEHHADLVLDLINIEATAVTDNLATGPVKLVAAYKALNRELLEDDLSEIFDTRGAVTSTRSTHRGTRGGQTRAAHVYAASPTTSTCCGDEGCRTIPSADRPQRTLVRPQPGAAATWTGGTRRRDLLTAEEDEEPIRPTSPEEVKAIVKSFRPNKAPGPDGITYRALKHVPKKFVNICNAMLRLRHFPSQWKLADVAMIPKPGQSHNGPQNYRPISLLPVMSKIVDRIILTRLREETDDIDVIPACQFSFRREHSTIVLRLVEYIKEGFNRRECTGAVFLDVANAFDKVWHQGLLLKMDRAGISKAMVKLIHSFLLPRTFQVKLEGRRSTTRTASAGVPQESAISPLLFNIYTSDIPTTAHVNLAMYADDVCIYSRSLNARVIDRRLQTALDTLRDWYAKWRIAVHPQKSTAVLFAIGGTATRRISPSKEASFLGNVKSHTWESRRFPGKLGSPHTPRVRPRT